MALTRSPLHIIKNRFPEQGERIEGLFSANEDFRALCSDYVLCMECLKKIKKEAEEKKLSIKEYKDVRTDLENELARFISNSRVLH